MPCLSDESSMLEEPVQVARANFGLSSIAGIPPGKSDASGRDTSSLQHQVFRPDAARCVRFSRWNSSLYWTPVIRTGQHLFQLGKENVLYIPSSLLQLHAYNPRLASGSTWHYTDAVFARSTRFVQSDLFPAHNYLEVDLMGGGIWFCYKTTTNRRWNHSWLAHWQR